MSKYFGVKTLYGQGRVRENDVSRGEADLPEKLKSICQRVVKMVSYKRDIPPPVREVMKFFEANECNANKYFRSAGHFLKPHFDDRFQYCYHSANIILTSLCGADMH